jgi:hypothetical protein
MPIRYRVIYYGSYKTKKFFVIKSKKTKKKQNQKSLFVSLIIQFIAVFLSIYAIQCNVTAVSVHPFMSSF